MLDSVGVWLGVGALAVGVLLLVDLCVCLVRAVCRYQGIVFWLSRWGVNS